jgi:hypothetical protein
MKKPQNDVMAWFFKPHTLFLLFLGVMFLCYEAFTRDEGDTVSNAKVYVP